MRRDKELKQTVVHLPRRTFVKGVGAALALSPLAQLLACGPDEGTETGGGTTGDGTWATGGTAAMAGNYADPFSSGIGTTCTLYKASTLGPCHAATVERKDISEGHGGLPVRLAFLIVNPQCQPVPGATLELWHTHPNGLYSGSDASNMCTSGDSAARAARWFRGIQTADANGRVDFDTCFPGWYRGRTIHIHFTVRVNGTEYLTSQLFFDDALNNEIISTQAVYGARGTKDTTNTSDNVLRQSGLTDALFQTRKMDDGALLAWKALVVHS
ncbi:protocatechuate 3,4-dioxygenase [Archangium sp.]|uniref:dioxygenase family protein n=1 Tax=Archangium sp. TaxID=1872627 RepID=UPI002ED8317F